MSCVLPPPLALRSRAAVASSLAAHPLPLVEAADRLRVPRSAWRCVGFRPQDTARCGSCRGRRLRDGEGCSGFSIAPWCGMRTGPRSRRFQARGAYPWSVEHKSRACGPRRGMALGPAFHYPCPASSTVPALPPASPRSGRRFDAYEGAGVQSPGRNQRT